MFRLKIDCFQNKSAFSRPRGLFGTRRQTRTDVRSFDALVGHGGHFDLGPIFTEAFND